MSAALAALLVPAAAGTASAKKKPPAPVVTSVRPLDAAVGDTLTIRGHHFRRGRGKNTVAFKRDGGRAVFVKADISTKRMMRVKLPARLEKTLLVRSGLPVPTRFRIRVLAARFGKSFTARKRSPVIGPPRPPLAAPPKVDPNGDCDADGVLNRDDADDDNDLLPDTVEKKYLLDSCKADTDGDGVTDGYEYRSAQDLNDDDYQAVVNEYVPYPGKMPYPNPLDGDDGNTDFDGDSLTLKEEFQLWRYTVDNEGAPANLDALTYSDGRQYSLSVRSATTGRQVPSMPVGSYTKHQEFVNWLNAHGYRTATFKVRPVTSWNDGGVPVETTFGIFDANLDGETPTEVSVNSDLDGDNYISDDERDEDADGLSNFDESHGRMTPAYWTGCYNAEKPYKIPYAGTSLVDNDSDGDGIPDGADDQDHDDVPNVMELSRMYASRVAGVPLDDRKTGRECKEPDLPPGAIPPILVHPDRYGRVNPFNPCMPLEWSRTCVRHPDLQDNSAPFDDSVNWWALN